MAVPGQTVDFIIIGAGPAGLVLANRLSEEEKLDVLVLEAGRNRNDDPKVMIPGFLHQLFRDPNYGWRSESVPQKGLNGRVIEQRRGKMIGGSTGINAMAAFFPSEKIFDVWAQYGNQGWDAASMTPYLKKWEGAHPAPKKVIEELGMGSYFNPTSHGTDGPVSTSYPKSVLPLSKVWVQTIENLDLKSKADAASGEAFGAFTIPSYVDPTTGTRSHAGTAFWDPVHTRKNLSLKEGAVVSKIIFDADNTGTPVATAVQYSVEGTVQTVFAAKEIILCAGGYGSPAILEMSGIGNPDILQPLGIDVVIANTCVGENLQDHPMNVIAREVEDLDYTADSLRIPERFGATMKAYTENKDGILANGLTDVSLLSVLSFMSPAEKKDFLARVDKVVETMSVGPAEKIRLQYFKSMTTSETGPNALIAPMPFSPPVGPNTDMFGVSIAVSVMCPLSLGSTHIESTDPERNPLIDSGYLSHPLDLELLAHQHLFARKLFDTEPFKSILKPHGRTNVPPEMAGPSGLPETLEQAKAWAQAGTGPQYHVSGTCSMMPRELGGVVDDRLRVHGVKKLRVCDASIFPVIPHVPITSTVYAVAERAVDLIKEDLKN